jgi:hypothetical protein
MPINGRKNICPICKFNNKNYKIYLKKNLNSNSLNEYSFSSRKTPEFMNFELIQCSKCSLIYSLNIPEFEKIYISYRDSAFVDVQDEKDAARTYLKYLKLYFTKNSYRIVYWVSLLPFPTFFKSSIIKILIIIGFSNVRLGINVGNILVVAYK